MICAWEADLRPPRKGNSNSHGARLVHLIILMIKGTRTSRLSIKISLFARRGRGGGAGHFRAKRKLVKRVEGLLSASQGQILAVTVLCVPSSLDGDSDLTMDRLFWDDVEFWLCCVWRVCGCWLKDPKGEELAHVGSHQTLKDQLNGPNNCEQKHVFDQSTARRVPKHSNLTLGDLSKTRSRMIRLPCGQPHGLALLVIHPHCIALRSLRIYANYDFTQLVGHRIYTLTHDTGFASILLLWNAKSGRAARTISCFQKPDF